MTHACVPVDPPGSFVAYIAMGLGYPAGNPVLKEPMGLESEFTVQYVPVVVKNGRSVLLRSDRDYEVLRRSRESTCHRALMSGQLELL